MNLRRREQTMLANPILIGALTVLVTIVAVYLAYNANTGLPFVPRYNLHVQIADASEVTKNTEVHMGGSLIGVVDSVTPARDASGQPIAVMNMALNKSVEPLPVDSTFEVRLKGAIGLKYVQVTPGKSTQTFKNGATVPLTQSGSEVDLDQVLSMFDPATRNGVAASTVGFSDALAGRGADINNAIGAFVPLVTDLQPVARNLAAPRTNLAGFWHGLESFTSALAPVAQTQANLFGNLNTTFGSLSTVAVPFLQNSIHQTPPTLQSVITNSPGEQAFLTDTADLFRELRPAIAAVRKSAPVLADAFATGTRTLPATYLPANTSLDRQLSNLATALRSYGQNRVVIPGYQRLTLTASRLRSPLAFLTPVQATCQYPTLFLRNIASLLSDPARTGTTLRFGNVVVKDVPGSEAVPSQKPYTTPNSNPAANIGPLHVNPYPYTASPGQPSVCAAGNEIYSPKSAQIGNPPYPKGFAGRGTTQTKRSGG